MMWRASTAERDMAFAVLTALFDAPEVTAVLSGLPAPRRRALEVALALLIRRSGRRNQTWSVSRSATCRDASPWAARS
jgi:hypothetical protein